MGLLSILEPKLICSKVYICSTVSNLSRLNLGKFTSTSTRKYCFPTLKIYSGENLHQILYSTTFSSTQAAPVDSTTYYKTKQHKNHRVTSTQVKNQPWLKISYQTSDDVCSKTPSKWSRNPRTAEIDYILNSIRANTARSLYFAQYRILYCPPLFGSLTSSAAGANYSQRE